MQAASGLLWTIQIVAQEYFTIKIAYYGKTKTTVNLNPLLHDHRDAVRAAYNHAQYLPERRNMMQTWSDFLDDLREKARQCSETC